MTGITIAYWRRRTSQLRQTTPLPLPPSRRRCPPPLLPHLCCYQHSYLCSTFPNFFATPLKLWWQSKCGLWVSVRRRTMEETLQPMLGVFCWQTVAFGLLLSLLHPALPTPCKSVICTAALNNLWHLLQQRETCSCQISQQQTQTPSLQCQLPCCHCKLTIKTSFCFSSRKGWGG